MLLRVPILAVALTLGPPVLAAPGHTPGNELRPIFRLGVSLVQLDVVITDRKGRHVTDLGPEDFEVVQNGKPQRVVGAIYVPTDAGLPTTDGGPVRYTVFSQRPRGIHGTDALQPPDRSPVAGRVVAFVVDDARMSFSGVYFTRDALLRFVSDDFRRGDRFGLIRASDSRSREVLTSIREEFAQSIRGLSFRDARALVASDEVLGRYCGLPWHAARLDAMLVNRLLGRVDEVVDALRRLPGRKAIVLVSEGFGSGDDRHRRLKDLVDGANRSGVAIYTMDPRGLELPCGVDGSVSLHSCYATQENTQDALHFIAGETGGFAVINTSNLRGGLARILNDQRGYYLIGYQPDHDTFSGTQSEYHKVKVKVRRKGLRVRSPQGFYAIPTR